MVIISRFFTDIFFTLYIVIYYVSDVSCRWCYVSKKKVISNVYLPTYKLVLILSATNRFAIFHFLFRENLLQQLHELYFLPNIPELSGVNAILRPYVDAMYRLATVNMSEL